MRESFRLAEDGVYRCDAFQEFIWQTHGFGTISGNPGAAITLRQIHSDRVWNAHAAKRHTQEGDALITDIVGQRIGVRTADCVPVLFLDSRNRAAAAIHAGWRGSAAQISVRTLEKMAEDFKTAAADVYAAIGPCIRACCYEVGEEVASRLAPFLEGHKSSGIGKQKIDLPGANRFQLIAAGVRPEKIFDCGLCTYCLADQFFSYRRHPGEPGRMLSAIARLA